MTETYPKASDKNAPPRERDWQDDFCARGMLEWERGRTFVSSLNDLYEDLYLMMRGERPVKNYDWQSNLTLRKAFTTVWTAISYITQKIYGGNPIIAVQGIDSKGCWQRERLLQVWMDADKSFMTTVLGLLRLLLNGMVFIKKGWKQVLMPRDANREVNIPVWKDGLLTYRPEKSKIQWTVPIQDRPDTVIVNNKDVVYDWMLKPGQSVTEGRFIIHREVVDLASLKEAGFYRNLDLVECQPIQSMSETADHSRLTQKDEQDNPPETAFYKEVEIFERQGILPVRPASGKDKSFDWEVVGDIDEAYEYGYEKKRKKNDVEWRQMIGTWAGRTNPVLIRCEENPYGEMTWINGQLYLDSERFNAVGIVEPAKDVFAAIDDNVNAMFDEIWKNLMPPTFVNKFMVDEWDSIKWAPSQIWLMKGNPTEAAFVSRGTNITGDAWTKHMMLDAEGQQLTGITPPVQGMGKDKTATMGVLNTQFSIGKLDFLIKLIEVTWLVPDSKMTLRFAQRFAHPLTFISMLGEAFRFDNFLEEYKFIPAAGSVKLPEQREIEVSQDLQLMQIVGTVQNPNTPKIMNYLLAEILRNRNKPQLAEMFDEDFFEPSSQAGNLQMVNRMIGQGRTPMQNEQGLPMSQPERGVRGRQIRGMLQ